MAIRPCMEWIPIKKKLWAFFIIWYFYNFWSAVVKIYPFATIRWVNNDKNMQPKTFSMLIGQYIISQLLKSNLLSETIYSQTQPAFICSNSAIITVEKNTTKKAKQEKQQMSTWCFIVNFGYVWLVSSAFFFIVTAYLQWVEYQ